MLRVPTWKRVLKGGAIFVAGAIGGGFVAVSSMAGALDMDGPTFLMHGMVRLTEIMVAQQPWEGQGIAPSYELRAINELFKQGAANEAKKNKGIPQQINVAEYRKRVEGIKILASPARYKAEGGMAGSVPFLTYAHPGVPKDAPVVLYTHGGGYIAGNPEHAAAFATEVSRLAGVRVMSIDYRLGPENPLPAGTDDAITAYRWLLTQVPANKIAVMGESAGGGLVLLALQAAKHQGLPMPACAVPISPWTDLSDGSPSTVSNRPHDVMLGGVDNVSVAGMATGTLDGMNKPTGKFANLTDPQYSPVYGDFTGLPPLYFLVGNNEMLRDDTLRAVEKAKQQGVSVDLSTSPWGMHVYPIFLKRFPEATEATIDIANFLKSKLHGSQINPDPFRQTPGSPATPGASVIPGAGPEIGQPLQPHAKSDPWKL